MLTDHVSCIVIGAHRSVRARKEHSPPPHGARSGAQMGTRSTAHRKPRHTKRSPIPPRGGPPPRTEHAHQIRSDNDSPRVRSRAGSLYAPTGSKTRDRPSGEHHPSAADRAPCSERRAIRCFHEHRSTSGHRAHVRCHTGRNARRSGLGWSSSLSVGQWARSRSLVGIGERWSMGKISNVARSTYVDW